MLFVRSVCACLDLSVSSSSWDLGRAGFVIVALPGLFSYLFFMYIYAQMQVIPKCFALVQYQLKRAVT